MAESLLSRPSEGLLVLMMILNSTDFDTQTTSRDVARITQKIAEGLALR